MPKYNDFELDLQQVSTLNSSSAKTLTTLGDSGLGGSSGHTGADDREGGPPRMCCHL